MNKKELSRILDNSGRKKICIIGDIMLDRYLLGDVTRISPEAPVQVFDIRNSEYRLGGAANVSFNVKTLGANPLLIGVIGNDSEADILKDAMNKLKIGTSGLISEKGRPTTCKTRVISDSHHLLRIDSESKTDISNASASKILQLVEKHSREIDIIILEDYNKGVLTKNLIREIIKLAEKNKIRVLVDPKFENFFEYRGVFLFKPNRKETEDAFGMKIKNPRDAEIVAGKLMNILKCTNVVLTLGEEGMAVFENKKGKIKKTKIKTHARKVADVSGAGDTVISTVAVCLAGGASLEESALVSNYAAGLVVEEVGIVPVDRKKLIENIS